MSPRILIADDNEDVCNLLVAVLGRDYTVSVVRNGKELYHLATGCRDMYNLIIADVVMPDMDGDESVELFRGLGCSVPVIMISGYLAEEITAPNVHWIAKPFDIAAFLALVRKLTQQ